MTAVADLLAVAVEAAHATGALLRERSRGPQSGITAKSSSTDLVSDADRDAEALLTRIIRTGRPDDALLGEEGAVAVGSSGVQWSIDPLDGTTNYLWGIPHWSVSIAAADADGDLAAVVYDPSRDETFTATRGQGAFVDGRRLALTPTSDLGRSLVGTGFSYSASERARQAAVLTGLLPAVRDIRRFGSAALDLAWVACGRLDAYFETGLNVWDWAAGAMIVHEAGGTVHRTTPGDSPVRLLAARPGLEAPLLATLDVGR